jgi:hypothetical protein
VTSDYDRGFADGVTSRDAEFEALERMVDFWYFRANNPRSAWPETKMVNSIIDGMEAREEWRKKREALDAAEQKKFDAARALIAEGLEDIEVAKRAGLFLPIVANLRAGVL